MNDDESGKIVGWSIGFDGQRRPVIDCRQCVVDLAASYLYDDLSKKDGLDDISRARYRRKARQLRKETK